MEEHQEENPEENTQEEPQEEKVQENTQEENPEEDPIDKIFREEIILNKANCYQAKFVEEVPTICRSNLERRLPCLSPENFEWETKKNQWNVKWIDVKYLGKVLTEREKKEKEINETKLGRRIEKYKEFVKKDDSPVLCLCGMQITKVYKIISNNNIQVQVGSKCIEKFMPELWEKYKEEQKKVYEGYCVYCQKDVSNLERHVNGSICKINKGKHYNRVKKAIFPVIARMVSDQKKKEKKRLKKIKDEEDRERLKEERERIEKEKEKEREEFLKNHKECLDCDEMIPKDPSWKVRCLKCYIKTKRKEEKKKLQFRDDSDE